MAYKGMREDVEHANAHTRLARIRTSYKARRLYFHDLTIRLRDKANTMRQTRTEHEFTWMYSVTKRRLTRSGDPSSRSCTTLQQGLEPSTYQAN